MTPVHTLGFYASANERGDHFQKHRAEFPLLWSEADYEDEADAFLGGPLGSGVYECTNSLNKRYRYSPKTGQFGAVQLSDNRIVTYFISGHGTTKNAAQKLAYFRKSCAE